MDGVGSLYWTSDDLVEVRRRHHGTALFQAKIGHLRLQLAQIGESLGIALLLNGLLSARKSFFDEVEGFTEECLGMDALKVIVEWTGAGDYLQHEIDSLSKIGQSSLAVCLLVSLFGQAEKTVTMLAEKRTGVEGADGGQADASQGIQRRSKGTTGAVLEDAGAQAGLILPVQFTDILDGCRVRGGYLNGEFLSCEGAAHLQEEVEVPELAELFVDLDEFHETGQGFILL